MRRRKSHEFDWRKVGRHIKGLGYFWDPGFEQKYGAGLGKTQTSTFWWDSESDCSPGSAYSDNLIYLYLFLCLRLMLEKTSPLILYGRKLWLTSHNFLIHMKTEESQQFFLFILFSKTNKDWIHYRQANSCTPTCKNISTPGEHLWCKICWRCFRLHHFESPLLYPVERISVTATSTKHSGPNKWLGQKMLNEVLKCPWMSYRKDKD